MAPHANEEDQYHPEAVGNADASYTFPAQASSIRKGSYAMLKNQPCKVLDVTTAKPGKHGHAKCSFRGKHIFTGATIEDVHPSSHNMDVPIVRRTEYDAMLVTEDGFLSLLTEDGEEKNDIKCPEGEVGMRVRTFLNGNKAVIVIVMAAMGQEMAIESKTGQED